MKREFNSCTIVRTMMSEHYTLNINNGEKTLIKKSNETRPCGIPLFSGDNRKAGVCSSCAKGWETEGNVFATPAERARATKL
jgi:hypothetical protein